MPRNPFAVLEGPEYKVPRFSAGAVAKIVGFKDPWKLQKLLGSPRYRLRASGQLGEGKGSRRWFTEGDVYRIGVAADLIRDGFAPRVVSAVLHDLDDGDLTWVDEQGMRIGFITFSRGGAGPKVGLFRSARAPEIRPEGPIYYALDLGRVLRQVDQRIQSLQSKHGK
jgi:hypothetical protein